MGRCHLATPSSIIVFACIKAITGKGSWPLPASLFYGSYVGVVGSHGEAIAGARGGQRLRGGGGHDRPGVTFTTPRRLSENMWEVKGGGAVSELRLVRGN